MPEEAPNYLRFARVPGEDPEDARRQYDAVVEYAKQRGWELLDEVDPWDSESMAAILLLNNAKRASEEAELRSRRVKLGMQHARERRSLTGREPGGPNEQSLIPGIEQLREQWPGTAAQEQR